MKAAKLPDSVEKMPASV